MGFVAALFVGISLGMMGGGGSILTVPVLVYLFGISPVLATSYSLFIVGTTSLAGALNSYSKGLVDLRTSLLFGLTSIATVFFIRKLIIPRIPEIITLGKLDLHFSSVTMVVFAVLMFLASISMIRSRPIPEPGTVKSKGKGLLFLYGLGIGLVTGFLGAGGGFLLIPVLVLWLRLDIKRAVGTSLLIIALNSLVGFAGDSGHFDINWTLLLAITAIAIGGVFIGNALSAEIRPQKLKKGFGIFILLVGIYIIVRELV